MNYSISVLMGVYNANDKIQAAVETIENQTERDIEFVICDDGSTDGTYEILQKISKRYTNILLLRNEKNQGLAYALNRCLQVSTGKYIARMDSDDLCKPERFAIQRDFLEKNPQYDLVGCNMIMLDDYNKPTFSRIKTEPTEKVLPCEVPFAHPTVLMHRYVLEKLGGYSVEKYTRRCEDLELWYRFFANGMHGYNLPDYLYIKKQCLSDYKKRKVIYGIEMCAIHFRGLKTIHAPWYRYILAIKPIISASIPKKIMMYYHAHKFKRPNIKKNRIV